MSDATSEQKWEIKKLKSDMYHTFHSLIFALEKNNSLKPEDRWFVTRGLLNLNKEDI